MKTDETKAEVSMGRDACLNWFDENLSAGNVPPGRSRSLTRFEARERALERHAACVLETKLVRMNYWIDEATLRRVVGEARRRPPATRTLLQLLECRLDNVLFSAGLARSIPAARRCILEQRVSVNERFCLAPSSRLYPGDVVHLHGLPDAEPERLFPPPGWLSLTRHKGCILVTGQPKAEDCLFQTDLELVLEHLSTRL